ncbi:MAG: hypothetical protein AW09_002920 [Candidatus Accumulibacter phosphatis]|uniref:Uncharacterized protein n=1 Tax=Candidatus Accumulibacter phosphatis TaxID=327160 RepID=A0A080LTQ8_9PROT|nr:MAG: hypothetical protein AW09_002920 [Candidatus Accumulibacter phosphatis]
MPLLVTRRNAGHVGRNPDLQKVRGLALGVVELAVRHAGAGTHALHVAGWNTLDIAHAVLMREISRQNVTDDFHVAVAMLAKAGTGGHPVLVDDPQVAPAHVRRVVITGE